MAEAARTAGVRIVTGDTKVVDPGKGDGVFINTAGVGWVPSGVEVSPARVVPGDVILLSGDLGRHGVAIMSVREGLRFEGSLESDCAPLAELVEAMLATGADLHCLRDLTRGGLASALNEIAADARVASNWTKQRSPWPSRLPRLRAVGPRPALCGQRRAAGGFCAGLLGRASAANHASSSGRRRSHADWRRQRETCRHVELRTRFGGRRIVDLLSGEQMPRIC